MARLHWLDVLISPLTWLARARGWRRLALLGLYGLILGMIGLLMQREAVLWRLPDAPEPFDLARYGHVELRDADNAMVAYAEAARVLIPGDRVFQTLPRGARYTWDWTRADPSVQDWAESNRAAVDLWLKGTTRPDALLVQPERYTISTGLKTVSDLRTLVFLGVLEANRRQASGDLAGAWPYYRGAIRSGLHAGRHAGIQAATIGARVLSLASPAVLAWVDDPKQTREWLRAAAGDLAACRSLQSSAGDAVRVEYFASRAALAEPARWVEWQVEVGDPRNWYYHLPGVICWGGHFLRNEPKRSLKILRLITAGQLAQFDRPAADRPRVVDPRYLIYAIGPATPPSLTRIRPETLAAWAEASGCHGVLLDMNFNLGFLSGTGNLLDELRLRVAERLYTLDHAGQFAPTYGDLMPTYIDVLPEGIAPGDALAAP